MGKMQHSKVPLVFLAVLLLSLSPLSIRTVSANWYSYYSQSGYYGLWSIIYTPTSKPYTPSNDNQSHSVTTPGGGPWVQAGWLLYPTWSQAKQYYEYGVGGVHEVVNLNNQAWGTGIKYEVSYDGSTGSNRWCVWINGVRIRCWNDVHTAPSRLIVQSETHTTTDTVFWTDFTYIKVRNAAGTWVNPTLVNHMHADPPYGNTILTNGSFRTWRHGIFLPLVVK
jgi:hypothetical protein